MDNCNDLSHTSRKVAPLPANSHETLLRHQPCFRVASSVMDPGCSIKSAQVCSGVLQSDE